MNAQSTDYAYRMRDKQDYLCPCIVCGKPNSPVYCSDVCADIDMGKLRVVTLAEMLEDR